MAASSYSINQAKALLHFVHAVGLAAASAVFDQALLGKVQIFEVVQVLKDGLTGIESLGAPGGLS
jgi:hypothetical protein